jgi:hypothetical protein
MQCIVHVWKSLDCDGNCFLLCVSPLNSIEGGAPIEAFADERSLAERLAAIGFSAICIRKNIFNLRNDRDANWSNLEVPNGVFERFGQPRDLTPPCEPFYQLMFAAEEMC